MTPIRTLGILAPAALARHADSVAARLEDSKRKVRMAALRTLQVLEPAVLAQHAGAVVLRLDDGPVAVEEYFVPQRARNSLRGEARRTLLALPLVVTRDIDFESHNMRRRLLGRIAWYRCRLRLRVRRIALYW